MVLKSVIEVTHSRFLKSFISIHHNEAYSSSTVPAAGELSLGKNMTFICCSNWDILMRMGNAHSTANGGIQTHLRQFHLPPQTMRKPPLPTQPHLTLKHCAVLLKQMKYTLLFILSHATVLEETPKHRASLKTSR
jgi:hypothetical protein